MPSFHSRIGSLVLFACGLSCISQGVAEGELADFTEAFEIGSGSARRTQVECTWPWEVGAGLGCELVEDGCIQNVGFPDSYTSADCWIQARLPGFVVETKVFQTLEEHFLTVDEEAFFSGEEPQKPVIMFGGAYWTGAGSAAQNGVNGSWKICPRSSCATYQCPQGYRRKWEYRSIPCSSFECGDEDLSRCCDPVCYLPSNFHLWYQIGAFGLCQPNTLFGLPYYYYYTEGDCPLVCNNGYTYERGDLLLSHCSTPGAEFITPPCVPPHDEVPWIVSGACERYGQDCVQSDGFPTAYSGFACQMSLPEEYLVTAVSFSTEEYFDVLEVESLFSASGTAGPEPFQLPRGSEIFWEPDADIHYGGWRLCAKPLCYGITCPTGLIFNCSSAFVPCQTHNCNDVETCCRNATEEELPSAFNSSADTEGCGLFTTTEITTTTTTATDNPNDATLIGTIELSAPSYVFGNYSEEIVSAFQAVLANLTNTSYENVVVSASFLQGPFWFYTEYYIAGEPGPIGGPGRRLTTEPTSLERIGFQVARGEASEPVIQALTPEEFTDRIQEEIAELVPLEPGLLQVESVFAEVGVESFEWLSPDPHCSDYAGFTDDFTKGCLAYRWWCTKEGLSTGNKGHPYYPVPNYHTFYYVLPRLSPPGAATARQACCVCGGGNCLPGSFNLRGKKPEMCLPCAPGTYSNVEDVGTECISCELGRYTSLVAAQDCDSSGIGFHVPETGSTVQVACPVGTFAAETGLSECTACEAGTYAPVPGSRICSECETGQYSATNMSTACMRCEGGFFANESGSISCSPCPVGTEATSRGASECSACSLGRFTDVPETVSCELCPPGRTTLSTMSSFCSECMPGDFAELRGQSQCEACPLGRESTDFGASACEACPVGQFKADGAQNCSLCEPGWFMDELASGICFACPEGQFQEDYGASDCHQCLNGTYAANTGASRCLECIAGSFAPFTGSTSCADCATGTYAALVAATACLDCSPGQYSPILGITACLQCSEGRSAANARSIDCPPCRDGSFADGIGLDSCTLCSSVLPGIAEHWVTMSSYISDSGEIRWEEIEGAVNVSYCGCKAGTQPNGQSNIDYENGGPPDPTVDGSRGEGCVTCEEGLECLGMGQLRIKSGYAWDGGVGVYDCLNAVYKACTGGLPGVCAPGRDVTSVACAECLEGRVAESNGSCVECGGADYGVPAVAAAVLVVCIVIAYYMFDRPHKKKPSLNLLCLLIGFGQLIAIIQQLGIVSTIRVAWDSPLSDAFDLVSSISFIDLDILRPGCVVTMDPVRSYVLRLVAVYFVLVLVIIAHAISTLLQHPKSSRWPVLLCALGTITMAFFVSIVSTMLGPLQCEDHPNGDQTVSQFPSVKCWKGGKHITMLITGIVSCTLPLCFLIAAIHAAYKFPHQLRVGAPNFLQGWAFMFFRYHTAAYWYGPVLLLRNALIAVVPALPTNVEQVLCLQVLLVMSLVLVLRVMPWRAYLSNYLEVVIHCVLLVLLSLAAFFVEDEEVDTLAIVGFSLMLLMPIAVGIILMRALIGLCRGRQKSYQYFLCHHKVGAGSFARLLKMRLLDTPGVRRKVFVDTDDLQNLDILFDIVAHDLESLVAIHSAQLLMRPWCIGEIVTSFRAKLTIQVLRLDKVQRPSDDFINTFEEHVAEIACLTEHDIDVDMIKEALRHFQGLHALHLPAELQYEHLHETTKSIVGYTLRTGSHDIQAPTADIEHISPLLVLADTFDIEAASIAFILRELVLPVIAPKGVTCVVLQAGKEVHHSVTKVALICTNGLFENGMILALLPLLDVNEILIMPVMCTSSFIFPTPQVLRGNAAIRTLPEAQIQRFELLVRSVFTEIAVEFSPAALGATEAVLKSRAADLAHRLWSNMQTIQTRMSTPSKHGSSTGVVVSATSSAQEDNNEAAAENNAPEPSEEEGNNQPSNMLLELTEVAIVNLDSEEFQEAEVVNLDAEDFGNKDSAVADADMPVTSDEASGTAMTEEEERLGTMALLDV